MKDSIRMAKWDMRREDWVVVGCGREVELFVKGKGFVGGEL